MPVRLVSRSAPMTVLRSILLFALAAVAEIGRAWLVWQGVRESSGWAWIGAGVIALGLYRFVATPRSSAWWDRDHHVRAPHRIVCEGRGLLVVAQQPHDGG